MLQQATAGRACRPRRGAVQSLCIGIAALVLITVMLAPKEAEEELMALEHEIEEIERYARGAQPWTVTIRKNYDNVGVGGHHDMLLRVAPTSTKEELVEALAAGLGMAPGAFGLVQADPWTGKPIVAVPIGSTTLLQGETYLAKPFPNPGNAGSISSSSNSSSNSNINGKDRNYNPALGANAAARRSIDSGCSAQVDEAVAAAKATFALDFRSAAARQVQPLHQQQQRVGRDWEQAGGANKGPAPQRIEADSNAAVASDRSVRVSGRPGKLSRVLIAALGTGRYRALAIEALETANKHFGGDCDASLHLLTDNIAGTPPYVNAAFAPYREWPESGLSKFEDILAAMRPELDSADYFYFIDGDVRFREDVTLADISGDLVGVEHPMYPRHSFGFCEPGNKDTEGFCRYPYDKDKRSHCHVPEGQGKFYAKITEHQRHGGTRKLPYYVLWSNAWYLQSAFWGGKTKFIIPMLEDLKERTAIDRANNVYSSIIQDERYFNYYMWKHGNRSDLVMRILPPSYLFPFNPHGFGEHIVNQSRPIIVHGTAKFGKLIKGEMELSIAPSGELAGKRWLECLDVGTLKGMIGTYGCHNKEWQGGSQGFIWKGDAANDHTGLLRVAYNGDAKVTTCVDGTDRYKNAAVLVKECDDDALGQKWRYNTGSKRFMNMATNLCLDPMRYDHSIYPEVGRGAKNAKWPVMMQPCGKSELQRIVITEVDTQASEKAAESKYLKEGAIGHTDGGK